MKDLKIRVDNDAESREVQELFFELGYKWFSGGNQVQCLKQLCGSSFGYLVAWSSGCFTDVIQCGCGNEDAKEITLPELRDMVVLKRNSIDDATHEDKNDPEFKYRLIDNHWYVITEGNPVWRKDSIDLNEAPLFIKPIEKPIEKPMKEYLRKNNDGEYILEVTNEREAQEPHAKHWIEIPEGATYYAKDASLGKNGNFFFRLRSDDFDFEAVWLESNWIQAIFNVENQDVLWQRTTHPEELPFIDDEPPQSLNDQYAEIEKVRQSAWQKQEGGSHYKNLKIQPMQYALENKLDYAQANVVKYVTRHKEKNGKEDLLKAIHNIELMIEFYYGDEK